MPRSESQKNKLLQVLWLATIIVAGLFLLSFLPEVTVGSFHLKKIDILSDVHADPPVLKSVATADTMIIQEIIPNDSIPVDSSLIQIEDFSSDGKNLKHFYYALQNADKRQVRIAFFGDSFIEGDIISSFVRDTLQQVFGGNGVGLVPMASEIAGFRKSIKHTYSNWETLSLLTSQDDTMPMGISGYTYLPKEDNTVTYKPGKVPHQQNFKLVKLLYQNEGSASIHYVINEGPEVSQMFEKSDSLKQFIVTHPGMQSIQLRAAPVDSLRFFGISFEDTRGVYVDNFSMRRNSGIALSKLSPGLLKQFNKFLDYKLIILQYGLNVASENDSTNYGWYTGKMVKIIKDLKEVFPKTSFLLLSVSDRGINKEGNVVTMESIPKMRNMQREIAIKSGIAFWDMFEAMGGRNSIANYTEAKPPMAAKDYTHLTHLGGDKIGRKLADALLHEFNKHENKNNIP
jgi:lysophospholipase L1-like esterase